MLRSLTAPLDHTLTTTQRLHINWQGLFHLTHELPIDPIVRRPGITAPTQQKYQEFFFSNKPGIQCIFYLNKPGNKCITDAIITYCEPAASVHKINPRAHVSYAELLLGNAEEFGVWSWTGSLCANHHFKFLRLPGEVPSCIQTLQPSQGDISKNNTGTHIMLLNTKKKELWKNMEK